MATGGGRPRRGAHVRGRAWTRAEDAVLAASVGVLRAGAIAVHLGRSRRSVYGRAYTLGLRLAGAGAGPKCGVPLGVPPPRAVRGPTWSRREIATLRRRAGRESAHALAARLGRTYQAVVKRACDLRVSLSTRHAVSPAQFSEQQLDALDRPLGKANYHV